jgi:hypothetical protein
MKWMCKREATSSFVTPRRPTDASPFPTTENLPKELFGRSRAAGLTVDEFVDIL